MTAQQIMNKINQLEAAKDRKKNQLELIQNELHYWETELEKIKKGK